MKFKNAFIDVCDNCEAVPIFVKNVEQNQNSMYGILLRIQRWLVQIAVNGREEF